MDDGEISVWAAVTVICYVVLSIGIQRTVELFQNGATGTIPNLLIPIGDQFVLAGLAIGFGYYSGKRLDMVQRYRRFGAEVIAGTAGAVVLTGVASQVFPGVAGGSTGGGDVVWLLPFGVQVVLTVTAFAFAGAAAVQLETLRTNATQSPTDGTDTASES